MARARHHARWPHARPPGRAGGRPPSFPHAGHDTAMWTHVRRSAVPTSCLKIPVWSAGVPPSSSVFPGHGGLVPNSMEKHSSSKRYSIMSHRAARVPICTRLSASGEASFKSTCACTSARSTALAARRIPPARAQPPVSRRNILHVPTFECNGRAHPRPDPTRPH